MYNNLLYGTKRRILDEIVRAFEKHPAFSEKVTVTNKFPYNERLQYGVVLRNSSASQIRMSPDNYLANYISHVRLGRVNNKPGYSVEWAREDSNGITNYVKDEDVSSQVNSTQRRFFTQYPIMAGQGNTEYATNVGQIKITINNSEVIPEFVYGKKNLVLLQRVPNDGDIVKVSYYRREIDNPGIYIIDFIEENQFIVSPIYVIEQELLVENTDGSETSLSLAHNEIYDGTEELYLKSKNGGNPFLLIKDTDYTINYGTGDITFLTSLAPNFKLFADYRYQIPNYYRGPYNFREYQEISNAISGVVLSIGRRAQKDDRQVIIIEKNREPQARIYGGHWEMALSLGVIAKDPLQMEQMSDQIVSELWGVRKNVLEFEGITLNSVEPTGEAEETFIDTTGDLYYESSIDISLMTEWQEFVPYFFEIKHIFVTPEQRYGDEAKFYYVTKDNRLIYLDIQPDLRKVIKYPSVGYERVA